MFEEPAAPDSAPRRRVESEIEWLERSDTSSAVRSRRLLREWISTLASDDADELSARLASGDDSQFHGAFLELYLHETFRRAGWGMNRHPVLPHTLRRPDFLVHSPLESTLVEATTVGPPPTAGADHRLSRLLDTVDNLDSTNFFLDVTVELVGPQDPPAAPLIELLVGWLAALDPDELDHDSLPRVAFSQDGWNIEFAAWPKPPTSRGTSGHRAIGAQSDAEGIQVVDDIHLRRVLTAKSTRYGRPITPYVIAVNDHPWSQGSSEHRVDALFRTPAMIIRGPLTGQWTRSGDGFWRRGSTWRHRRVSAVLLLSHLSPANATDAVPELWLNPKADLPTQLRLPHWATHRVEDVDGLGTLRVDPPLKAPGSFWAAVET